MLDINQHIVKNDDNKPLHSSGFAVVANGNHIGSTDSTSFSDRQKIEASRQFIQNYKSSLLANRREAAKNVKVFKRDDDNLRVPDRSDRQGYNNRLDSTKRSPYGFVEPKPRTYNPFA